MITEEAVVRLFIEANPVATGHYVDATEEIVDVDQLFDRSTPMIDLEVAPAAHLTRPPRKRWPAVAAAIVLVIAGVVVALSVTLSTSSDTEAGLADPSPPADPEAIAFAFVDARNAFDGRTAQLQFASDAVFDDDAGGVDTIDDLPILYDWYSAVDFKWTITGCTSDDDAERTTVTCDYEVENAISQVAGASPTYFGTFVFEIVDGEISAFFNQFPGAIGAWVPFQAWADEFHPTEAADVIYERQGLSRNQPALTDESVDLWDRYVDEFAEYQMEE